MPATVKSSIDWANTGEKIGFKPLCVDLDGTLIRTDLLWESVFLLLRQNFFYVFCIPFLLLKGKAWLKRSLAQKISFDPCDIHYNEPVLAWVRKQRKLGRYIVLATASNQLLAEKVASHLGCFDEVIASNDVTNLSSEAKRAALVDKFGQNGFDYVGNSYSDLAVWNYCDRAIVVHASRRTLAAARRTGAVTEVFPKAKVKLKTLVSAARLHQWIKNVLVALPLFASHKLSNAVAVKNVVLLFFAFSACASVTYIINDLLDLSADRKHPIKANRPFASGELSIVQGLALALGFAAVSIALTACLPLSTRIVVALYFILTLSYSVWLKQRLILDVLVLASLYTVRIVAGGVATHIKLSDWLISFSLFLFLSLAICKRSSELMNLLKANKTHTAGRSYKTGDLEPLNICGICSGMLACLLILFYASSQQAQLLYATPRLLYFLCPLLFYWISRLWVLTFRGELKEDPILFAVRDRVSYAVCIAMVLIAGVAASVKLPLDRYLQ
jgi:4-hydroxybenzoate polyprenyltransferase